MKKLISLSLVLIIVLGAFFVLSLSASAASPGLSVVLSAGGGVYSEGDTITYDCTITNVGDVEISELTAYDTLGVTSPSLGTLYPGSSTSFSFSYTVTAPDESAGSVYCSVSVNGMVPGGAAYSAGSNTVSIPTGAPQPDGSADVIVTVTAPQNGSYYTEGETVYYNANIHNSGYVDLNNVTVKDSLNNKSDNIGTVPLGDYVNYGFSYIVTKTDVDNETLQCFCVITATLPDGSDYGAMSNTIVLPLSTASAQASPITPDDTAETTKDVSEATSASVAPTSASTAPTAAKDQQAKGNFSLLSIFGNIYILIAIIAVVLLAAGTVVVVLLLRKKKKK